MIPPFQAGITWTSDRAIVHCWNFCLSQLQIVINVSLPFWQKLHWWKQKHVGLQIHTRSWNHTERRFLFVFLFVVVVCSKYADNTCSKYPKSTHDLLSVYLCAGIQCTGLFFLPFGRRSFAFCCRFSIAATSAMSKKDCLKLSSMYKMQQFLVGQPVQCSGTTN